MNAIRSLLAVTDFSEEADRAVRRAGLLAQALGARFEVLHVVSGTALASLTALPGFGDVAARLVEDARHRMEAVAAAWPGAATRVELGPLPEHIIEASKAHDMLVLGARGAGSKGETLIGTTAGRLLVGASCAILVVRSEPRGAYRQVLVPCEYAPPARRALELALGIAPGARITLLHVSEDLGAQHSWTPVVGQDEIAAIRAAVEERTLAWLSELKRGLDGADGADTRVEFGNPRRAILAAADRQGADLIVMGKQGRSKVLEMFVGSHTRRVLDQATCDVLVAPSS